LIGNRHLLLTCMIRFIEAITVRRDLSEAPKVTPTVLFGDRSKA